MEPQEYNYCCEQKKKCKKFNCLGIVAVILLAFLTLVIGAIIGAEIAETIIAALASVVVLAIILALLLIITIILLLCKNQKNTKPYYNYPPV